VIIYYLFLNPLLYWIPASLPFLNLGKTRFEEEIAIKRYSRLVAPLALRQIKRSKNITSKRVDNGLWYKNNIIDDENIDKVREFKHATPVYLRYPIKIKQKQKKEIILNVAKKYGITISYPKSLNRLDEIEEYFVNPGSFGGAEQVSEQIITLPTHIYINDKDRKVIMKMLSNC
jgi:dTDP-4-amino-4,6-dideoxygalactose transaminase